MVACMRALDAAVGANRVEPLREIVEARDDDFDDASVEPPRGMEVVRDETDNGRTPTRLFDLGNAVVGTGRPLGERETDPSNSVDAIRDRLCLPVERDSVLMEDAADSGRWEVDLMEVLEAADPSADAASELWSLRGSKVGLAGLKSGMGPRLSDAPGARVAFDIEAAVGWCNVDCLTDCAPVAVFF